MRATGELAPLLSANNEANSQAPLLPPSARLTEQQHQTSTAAPVENESIFGWDCEKEKKSPLYSRRRDGESQTFTETELQQLIAEQSYSLAATGFFVNHQTLACCSGKICKVLIVYFSFSYF